MPIEFYADMVGMVLGSSILGVLTRTIRKGLIPRLWPFKDMTKGGD